MTAAKIYKRIIWLVAALLLLGVLPVVGAPAGAQTPSQGFSFLPATIDEIKWIANGPIPRLAGVSGDLAAYGIDSGGCGHCGPYTSSMVVYDLIGGRKVTIKPAIVESFPGSGRWIGASEIQLSAPILLWKQPDRSAGIGSFTPGDFECTTCFYNIATGEGGEWTGGALRPNPESRWQTRIISATYPSRSADTIEVVERATGRVVLRQQLEPGAFQTQTAVGTDKIVFAYAPEGYPGRTLIKVLWLIQPNPAFTRVWAKADQPVASRKVARSWLWGPAPLYLGEEAYNEGSGGRHMVQYFDKSRMEVNDPEGDPNNPYYVTNGLLPVEMLSGEIQIGDTARVQASVPATIPVAGDPRKDNPLTPSYETMATVASLKGENRAPDRTGQRVDDTIDVYGIVRKDPARASLARYVSYVTQTGHNIPDVFNTYLNGMNGTFGYDWVYVLGYPITEAYWTRMRVSGRDMPVLVQVYQRRVLTYTPDFPAGWRVQQGNVGQHYLEWRYALNSKTP
jgi:hypothetical protein